MANYEYLPASNGSGDAALMTIGTDRLSGVTTINVDVVTNVPTKFFGTWGTLGANGLITPASKRDFRGRVSGADIIIDAMETGSVDDGNVIGQVIIVKPNTSWANRVATFIKNATNNGTPENLWAAVLNAASAVITGALSVGSNLTVTGNTDVTGNLAVTGTSRVIPVTVASTASITPSSQIYDVTALAVTAVINAPSFAAANGISMIIRIKDNGTARALSFNAIYTNVSGLDTPTTTVAGKLLTIGAMYNSATSKWEIQGLNQQA